MDQGRHLGHEPATALFRGQLEIDADNYLVVQPGTSRTTVPGVFACGDVMDKHYRQAVTAADPCDSVRSDQEHAANDVNVAHQAYYDRSAEAIVFQVINQRTDQVVDQYPDEAVLRRRAYFHSLDLQTEQAQVTDAWRKVN